MARERERDREPQLNVFRLAMDFYLNIVQVLNLYPHVLKFVSSLFPSRKCLLSNSCHFVANFVFLSVFLLTLTVTRFLFIFHVLRSFLYALLSAFLPALLSAFLPPSLSSAAWLPTPLPSHSPFLSPSRPFAPLKLRPVSQNATLLFSISIFQL